MEAVIRKTLTFTMDPEKASRQIPLFESGAFGKPHGRFTIMDSPSNDVVFRRIRRRDPTSGIPLQLVTWGMVRPSQCEE